ncbi:MAG: ABC transporter permease [Candidatus Wallbacteria bacterium]|nr:ABC transporter permease [Candidatus Wallbacteria bacterium]
MAVPIQYNIRNLFVRKVSTSMTVAGIALVVSTFVSLMALVTGLQRTLVEAGDPRNVILMRKGGISEAASALTMEQYTIVRHAQELAPDGDHDTLASPELAQQVLLQRKDGKKANVLIRGVRPVGFRVHDRVRVAAGRPLAARSGQILVGKAVSERYKGLALGDTLRFGRRDWPVVGVFEEGGSAHESEIWADADDLMGDLKRTYFNSMTARLRDPSLAASLSSRLDADPRLNLDAKTETEYYADQAEGARWMRVLGLGIALVMAIGAVFAAMNTMYAAIGSRTKEIGTLRALGFSRGAILASFMLESVLLALPGGILGCILAWPLNGLRSGTINMASFSEVMFEFTITPRICLEVVGFAVLMGVVGGFLPARRAATLPILTALREL